MKWLALACALAWLVLAPAMAQDAEAPRLTVDLDGDAAIPGQSVSLRLTVLVPTYMPKPPVWPSFETPNLLVRVASTGPTSSSIGGATWAGVTRRYLISPMVPGAVALPVASIVVTYADPATNEPVSATLQTDPFTITGTVPDGAEGLDPFVAADALTLSQTLDGDPAAMVPGDSVVRTVTATIRGTSPMFLPPLVATNPIEGVRAYPDEPVVEEKSERGIVSGTRTERVTYVAEGGGQGEAPAVTLGWYDLGAGAVETAEVSGFAIAVEGPPAARAEPRDWRMLALWAAGATVALLAFVLVLRRVLPLARRALVARRAAWLASEAHAFRTLMHVVARRDHAALRPALDLWATRVRPADPRRDRRLSDALLALGAARYGPGRVDEAAAWGHLAGALENVRHTAAPHRRSLALPPLNPVGS